MIIVHTLFVLQETRSGLVSYYDDRGDSVHTIAYSDVGYYSIASAASVFVAMSSVTVYSVPSPRLRNPWSGICVTSSSRRSCTRTQYPVCTMKRKPVKSYILQLRKCNESLRITLPMFCGQLYGKVNNIRYNISFTY